MKPRNLILILVLLVFITIVVYSFLPSAESPKDYIASVQKDREQKDEFMRTAPDSPFAGKTSSFHGLNYYPVDPGFKIKAQLTPIDNKNVMTLATTDGSVAHYLQYGYATFDRDGFNNKLLILEVMDDGPHKGDLFLAFGDATSGNDTYGAGRYLDIKKVPAATTIVLDFNKAYNPYCAYSNGFSCPLPPRENLLQIPIQAGEKDYHP